MSLPKLDASHTPEQLLSDITDYIAAAEAKVAARDAVTLADLDTVVDALCQRILAAEAPRGEQYAAQLEQLVLRLEGLQKQMKAFQGEVMTTITSLNTTKNAAKAYKKNAPEE